MGEGEGVMGLLRHCLSVNESPVMVNPLGQYAKLQKQGDFTRGGGDVMEKQ